MPNYLYKCEYCGGRFQQTLPISSDPKEKFPCNLTDCDAEHNSAYRVIGPGSSFKMGRETLGKWFKNETGKELLGDRSK